MTTGRGDPSQPHYVYLNNFLYFSRLKKLNGTGEDKYGKFSYLPHLSFFLFLFLLFIFFFIILKLINLIKIIFFVINNEERKREL